MCEFLEKDKCLSTNNSCPYVFFCTKENRWKPLKSMPENCRQAKRNTPLKEIPKGAYIVEFVRHGYLYVNIEGNLYKFVNPFNYEPEFVKMEKEEGKWTIKQ